MEDGGWRMRDGGWRMQDGEWDGMLDGGGGGESVERVAGQNWERRRRVVMRELGGFCWMEDGVGEGRVMGGLLQRMDVGKGIYMKLETFAYH